jgi:hypothetical protein
MLVVYLIVSCSLHIRVSIFIPALVIVINYIFIEFVYFNEELLPLSVNLNKALYLILNHLVSFKLFVPFAVDLINFVMLDQLVVLIRILQDLVLPLLSFGLDVLVESVWGF